MCPFKPLYNELYMCTVCVPDPVTRLLLCSISDGGFIIHESPCVLLDGPMLMLPKIV